MNRSIPAWQIAGFIFTSILGTLLHCFFDFTGSAIGAALVSAVNESIWEHMKLIYVPMVIFGFIEFRVWGKSISSYWCIKILGLLAALFLIPIIYYTYTGILGINADWFNITIFFLAAGTAFYLETRLFQKNQDCRLSSRLSLGMVLLIGGLFLYYTFQPPHIPLFQDPMTGSFGFQG